MNVKRLAQLCSEEREGGRGRGCLGLTYASGLLASVCTRAHIARNLDDILHSQGQHLAV